MTKSEKKGNFSYKNWRSYAWRPMITPRSINKRLKLVAGKLHSRWDGPFVITNIFPYGAVELRDEASNKIFQVNRHQLKHFHEGPTQLLGKVESISIKETNSPGDTP
ncbi:hypothetical protein CR513_19020, partial [Mucuna pruriens]